MQEKKEGPIRHIWGLLPTSIFSLSALLSVSSVSPWCPLPSPPASSSTRHLHHPQVALTDESRISIVPPRLPFLLNCFSCPGAFAQVANCVGPRSTSVCRDGLWCGAT